MTKGLPMKPSPMLEQIKARQVVRATLVRPDGWDADTQDLYQDCAALLALISAQPKPNVDGARRDFETFTHDLGLPLVVSGIALSRLMTIFRNHAPDPARAEQVPEREGK